METEKHAGEMCVTRIRAKMVALVSQLILRMTASACQDGLVPTVKLDNTAFQIRVKTEELVSQKIMATDASV